MAGRALAVLANPVATGRNLFNQLDLQGPPRGMVFDRNPKPWFEPRHEPTKILHREWRNFLVSTKQRNFLVHAILAIPSLSKNGGFAARFLAP